MEGEPTRVVILGAGGRDFHNFNVYFRDNERYRVVAFTSSSQIPGMGSRSYPPELAGKLYPKGIPIVPEESLEEIIRSTGAKVGVLSYSDLSYAAVGRLMSRVLAAGASFMILGPDETMLKAKRPVIAVTAVRTGAGKSSVSRQVARILRSKGLSVIPVRHPMAYRDFSNVVECFSTLSDLDERGITIEEREEYEHYVNMGLKVCAGIDYAEVLRAVEGEADVILWDGGNNDWPFVKPDYTITVADATRPGQEISSFPGEVNVRMADLVIINKANSASREDVEKVKRNVRSVNQRAKISVAVSEVTVAEPELVKGKRVAVVEDSPTVTHGEAKYGAGYVAAKIFGAKEIVDPRPYAVGVIAEMFATYPHMAEVVPSTGYSESQRRDLEETLRRMPVDVIVSGTPIDLARIIKVDKPIVRARFEVKVIEGPTIEEAVEEFLERV